MQIPLSLVDFKSINQRTISEWALVGSVLMPFHLLNWSSPNHWRDKSRSDPNNIIISSSVTWSNWNGTFEIEKNCPSNAEQLGWNGHTIPNTEPPVWKQNNKKGGTACSNFKLKMIEKLLDHQINRQQHQSQQY